MNRHRRSIVIDTDTACDDAVALIMALRSPRVEVKAITTVAGNVTVEQATRNALFVVEPCGADVRVFSGAAKPLGRKLQTAEWFNGRDGLGDHGYAPSVSAAAAGDAVDALTSIIHATPGIELITLGPLTNLALALNTRLSQTRPAYERIILPLSPC